MRKLVSVVTAIALTVAGISVNFSTAKAATDVIKISTQKQLIDFWCSNQRNVRVELTKDIIFDKPYHIEENNYNSFAVMNNCFFDGNGHTIKNFEVIVGDDTTYYRAFHELLVDSTITDVVIERTRNIEGDDVNIGLLAEGSRGATIDNIELKGSFSVSSTDGISFQFIAGSMQESTLSHCINNMKVNFSDNITVKGMATYIQSGTIIDCVNNANMNGDICSCIVSDAYKSTIKNVVNNGNIVTSSLRFGAVAQTGDSSKFYSCVNNGVIVSTHEMTDNGTVSGSIGGIAGKVDCKNGDTLFSDCHNRNKIECDAVSEVGGIVGDNEFSDAFYNYIFTGCSNEGDIIVKSSNGGINTGGILGFGYSTEITNCINSGNISCQGLGTGGIVGELYSYTCKMTSCLNTGNVTGGKFAGGAVGYYVDNKLSASKIFNTGTVGSKTDGAVVGKLFNYENDSAPTLSECEENHIHTYVNTIVKKPTVQSTGILRKQCSKCNIYTDSTIAKLKVGKSKVKSVKNVKKLSIKVTFAKASNAKTYQIQYANNRKFKSAKRKTAKKLTYTITKLKKGKIYWIRVRAVNGKVNGVWSTAKRIKVTK